MNDEKYKLACRLSEHEKWDWEGFIGGQIATKFSQPGDRVSGFDDKYMHCMSPRGVWFRYKRERYLSGGENGLIPDLDDFNSAAIIWANVMRESEDDGFLYREGFWWVPPWAMFGLEPGHSDFGIAAARAFLFFYD